MRKPKTQTSPYELGRGGTRTRRSTTSTVHQRHGDRASGDDDEAARRFLTDPQVCSRYQISDMSLWRWLQDPGLNFPQPAMRTRGRRYWLAAELVAWERSRIPHGDDAVRPRRSAERDAAAPPT